MSKTLELKSAFTTKKEWYDYVSVLYRAGKINESGYMLIRKKILESNLPFDKDDINAL